MPNMTLMMKSAEDKMVLIYALAALKRLRKRDADYREEVEYYGKKGYRPHYCIHGTDLWTDYDNICGPCEDGATIYEEALAAGRYYAPKYMQMLDAYMKVKMSGLFSDTTTRAMVDDMLDFESRYRG